MDELNDIAARALAGGFLSREEGLALYRGISLPSLMFLGHRIRQRLNPGDRVGWMIDRNVNITNVCVSACKFCNYYRGVNHPDAYVTTMDQYRKKIGEMWQLGGRQLLLQGGLHPRLGLSFYVDLFRSLKEEFPGLRLHALGPAEIVHLAKMESASYRTVLETLVAAGLDSLPGAGAEILSDRVRSAISKSKCTAGEWLGVMRDAHRLGLYTSATMMFGHIETLEERFDHLIAIRQVQEERPAGTPGFIAFIPWPFQDDGTWLQRKQGVRNTVTPATYIRTIAIARIMLPNIPNIQASWLTVGKPVAQCCLHAGANDFGSIMIEENVVSVAGATHTFDAAGIRQAIREAGFTPYRRNQRYEPEDTGENA